MADDLSVTYRDGIDLVARAHKMSAEMMGSAAFQKGLGAIHALSHPVSTMHHTNHGTSMTCSCLP